MKNQKLLPHIKSEINSGKVYNFLNKKDDKYEHNYVYLLIERNTHMMYPGVRSSNTTPLQDLGISYFTSSQYINFKTNPENWDYIIVGDYSRRSDAVCLESALHKQHDVKNNSMFYNKCNQTITGFDYTGHKHSIQTIKLIRWHSTNRSQYTKDLLSKIRTGKPKTKEHSKKIGLANTGRKHSIEAKQKMSSSATGRKASESTKLKMSKAQTGRKHTQESKDKMSKLAEGRIMSQAQKDKISKTKMGSVPWNKGIPQKIIKCPHCSKIGGSSAMKQWHFDNCKHK